MEDNLSMRCKGWLRAARIRSLGWLRKRTDSLSARQRWVVLSILFAAFVAVDVIYIVRGFQSETHSRIEIEHARKIELNNQNTYDNDTTEETGDYPGEE
jgi:hypothetical protein